MSGSTIAAIVGDGIRCILYRTGADGKRRISLGDHPCTQTTGWTLQWLERCWAYTPGAEIPWPTMVPHRIDAVLTSPDGDQYAYVHHQPMCSGDPASPDLGSIQPLDAALAEAGISSVEELVGWDDLSKKS